MTDIALRSGFDSSSGFLRAFKKRFGISPSAFDAATFREYNRAQNELPNPIKTSDRPFDVTIKDVPERQIAYKRITRPYEGSNLCDGMAELLSWAHGDNQAQGAWISYSWYDPDVTPRKKCTYDIAVVVDTIIPNDTRVSWRTIPAVKVVQIHISDDIFQEMQALDWIYKSWLPASQYLPADYPYFEAFNGRPEANDSQHYELNVQASIERY
jgi:AraC family transcriptional regulator